MNDRQTEAMIDEIYDTSKEDTLLSMVGELYTRRMLPSLLVHGAYSLAFIVPAVYCAIKFFDTQQIQYQLMYAAIFVCCIQVVFLSQRQNRGYRCLPGTAVEHQPRKIANRFQIFGAILFDVGNCLLKRADCFFLAPQFYFQQA